MRYLGILALAAGASLAAASGPFDDILGRTDGHGPVILTSSGEVCVRFTGGDSVGPMVLLDSVVGVITAEGVQSYIEGARGDSAWLVAWHDNRRRSKNDIFAARLNSSGRVLDSTNIVISGRTTEESYPAVGFDGTNWLVVWSDLRSGIADIYGARVAQDGRVLDTAGFLISGALYTQTLPAVDFNGTNYLAVWTDYRTSTYKTYCARVTPTAQVLDPAGILLSGGGCLYPAVASNGSDWLATWHDEPAALIMAGRVGPDGAVRDPGGFVVGSGDNDRFFPDAACDGANYFVVWQDRRQGTSVDYWSVYGARIASDGTVLDPTGEPITNNDSKYEGIPQVWFNDTAYFVTWKDDGYGNLTGSRVTRDFTVLDPTGISLGRMPQWFADIDGDGTNWLVMSTGNRESGGMGGGEDACATRVTPAGAVLDPYPNIQLALSAHWQHRPAAAFDGERWLAVWMEQKALGENDIRGTLLDAQGLPIGDAFTICGAAGYASLPTVCAGDSGWLVAWQDYRAGQLDKLYAARVTRSGTVLDPNGFGVATNSDVNRYPAIAFDGTNWMVVFWTWIGRNYHIYGARITQSGTVLDPNGFDVVQAVYGIGWNNHVSLGLAFDGTNYLMIWPDYRNGEYDIYGSRITPAGGVLEPEGFTICRTGSDQDYVRSAYGGGRHLAVWHDTRGGHDVYATLIDPLGVSLDTIGFLVSRVSLGALDPQVTFAGANFVVAWTDTTNGDRDVMLCRVSPAGNVVDPNGIPAAATKQTEEYPAVAGGGPADQALVLMHSYAPAPWQCSRIWAGMYSELTGLTEGLRPAPAAGALRISPNPLVAGFATVELAEGRDRIVRQSGLCPEVSVCDASGRSVLAHRLAPDARRQKLDLRRLSAGVYLLRLDAGRYSTRQKLVIQR